MGDDSLDSLIHVIFCLTLHPDYVWFSQLNGDLQTMLHVLFKLINCLAKKMLLHCLVNMLTNVLCVSDSIYLIRNTKKSCSDALWWDLIHAVYLLT